MTLDEFLEAALAALGGRDLVLGVRSYHARARREPAGVEVVVARAAGGRIRVDEVVADGTKTLVVDGCRGVEIEHGVAKALEPEAVASLRREARLVPRNLLAHGREYDLALAERSGVVTISFPAERVTYEFDASTLLCRGLVDEAEGRRIDYDDYRAVGGIQTAFRERTTPARHGAFHLVYESVEYNEDLPGELFLLPETTSQNGSG